MLIIFKRFILLILISLSVACHHHRNTPVVIQSAPVPKVQKHYDKTHIYQRDNVEHHYDSYKNKNYKPYKYNKKKYKKNKNYKYNDNKHNYQHKDNRDYKKYPNKNNRSYNVYPYKKKYQDNHKKKQYTPYKTDDNKKSRRWH